MLFLGVLQQHGLLNLESGSDGDCEIAGRLIAMELFKIWQSILSVHKTTMQSIWKCMLKSLTDLSNGGTPALFALLLSNQIFDHEEMMQDLL